MFRFSWILLVSVLSALAGCGPAPPSAAKRPPSGKNSRPKPKPAPVPKAESNSGGRADTARATDRRIAVSADSYASVDSAIEAFRQAVELSENEAILKSEGWLSLQKDKSVAPLAALLQSDATSIELRFAACRTLGKTGPAATPVLIATIDAEDLPAQLRLKAVESLSYVRPSSRQIVDRLGAIAGGDEEQMRQFAIQGLGRIGRPAKSKADFLVGLLNNPAESDTIRSEAQRALKEVDPRRGLMGVAPPNK